MNQLSIFDFEAVKPSKVTDGGCYITAHITNTEPYCTHSCINRQKCGTCPREEKYLALRQKYEDAGENYIGAIIKAKEDMLKVYDIAV